MEGIENFRDILELSDGIMVARGDMGVEVDFEKLPGIQKKFIKECCRGRQACDHGHSDAGVHDVKSCAYQGRDN